MELRTDYDFSDLLEASWCGATDVLKKVEEFGYEDEFMDWLEESFSSWEEVPTLTEVNDFLWFENDAENWLVEQVGSKDISDCTYDDIIDFCKAFYKSYSVIQSEDETEVESFFSNNNNFSTLSEVVEAMQDYGFNDWEEFKADYK